MSTGATFPADRTTRAPPDREASPLKKLIITMISALAIMFGGVATAQADENTTQAFKSVYYPYAGNLAGVYLVVDKTNGTRVSVPRDRVVDGFWRICAPNISKFLHVERPNGTRFSRPAGACYTPTASSGGQWKAWVKNVN